MKNSIFTRFARAFFIFWHFEDLLVLSTTWNDLFCICVDDVSIWWQMFSFVFLCPKRWFQFNFRMVRTHFSSIMSLNNWKMIAETQSYISRWRSRFRRRRELFQPGIKTNLNEWRITLSNHNRGRHSNEPIIIIMQSKCLQSPSRTGKCLLPRDIF